MAMLRRVKLALVTLLAVATATHAAPVLIAPTTRDAPAHHGSFVSSPDGLVARVLTIGQWPTAYSAIQSSLDQGRTWTTPTELFTDLDRRVVGVAGTTRVDYFVGWNSPTPSLAHLARSTDGGVTFSFRDVTNVAGVVGLATSRSGALARFENSVSNGALVATSTDDGATWRATPVGGSAAGVWTGDEDLLACWIDFQAPAQPMLCRRSRNSGLDFAPVVTVSQPPSGSCFNCELQLAAGAPGEAFLLTGYALAHTMDGGDTWSVVDLDDAIDWRRLAARGSTAWIMGDRAIVRTTDGVTLEPLPLPTDSQGCGPFAMSDLVVFEADHALLGPFLQRTENAGLSWSDPVGVNSNGTAATSDGVDLVRLPDGRLVGLWSSRSGVAAPLRSSFSDDGGLTWSPASTLNDRPRSIALFSSDLPFAAESTKAGEVVVLWPSTTGELRATASRDGALTWGPSSLVAAGPFGCGGGDAADTMTIVADGVGRLLVSWLEGYGSPNTFAHMVRSSDGGLTWSPDEAIAFNSKGLISPVRAADGTLVLGLRTFQEWNALGRSSDGGASWAFELLSPTSSAWAPADFVATPQRLFAAEHDRCARGGCWVNENLESHDGGHTWTGTGTNLRGSSLLAGDEAGNIYAYLSGNSVHIVQPRGPSLGVVVDWPAGPIAATALAPLELGVVRAVETPGTTTPVPGIYYEVLGAGAQQVLRDYSITALDPRPDIASLFPLPYAALDASSPWVDDGVRPWSHVDKLVVYQIATSGPVTLKIVKGPKGLPALPLAVTLSW